MINFGRLNLKGLICVNFVGKRVVDWRLGKDGAALQHIYVDNGLTNAPVNFTLLSSVILGFSGIA